MAHSTRKGLKAGQAGVMAEQTMNGLKGPAPGPKTGANLTTS